MARSELSPISIEDGITSARRYHHAIIRRETPDSPWYVQEKDILGHQPGHAQQAAHEADLNLVFNRSQGNIAEYKPWFLKDGEQIPKKAKPGEEPYVTMDGIPLVMYTHSAEETEQPVIEIFPSS